LILDSELVASQFMATKKHASVLVDRRVTGLCAFAFSSTDLVSLPGHAPRHKIPIFVED